MVGDATLRYLETHPGGLATTARLFAAMHVSMTDAAIKCWQLQRYVGFWRPFQAVAAADVDVNPDIATEDGWTPLLGYPPYSDYVSGHACLTSPQVAVVRRMLGEDTPLELRSVNFPMLPRTYPTLTDLEHDALLARIWGGPHFRNAMEDGYSIGHRTAARVLRALD